jgi:CRISPR system Cascade subunit CasE
MYLARLFLEPSARLVRADVANPEGLHKTVMRMFPKDAGPEARKTLGVLHRLDESSDGRLMLLVQSRTKPDTSTLSSDYLLDLAQDAGLVSSGVRENPSIRAVTDERAAIGTGARFHFRLKANTTKKIGTKSGPGGVRNNGKRVEVRGDELRLGWLRRHADASGFAVTGARVTEVKSRGHDVRVAGAIFDGVLEVLDPSVFRKALEEGIGPAKAYGFGLLSIRPVTQSPS